MSQHMLSDGSTRNTLSSNSGLKSIILIFLQIGESSIGGATSS